MGRALDNHALYNGSHAFGSALIIGTQTQGIDGLMH